MLACHKPEHDTVLYHVRPGDSLNKIITHYFGAVDHQQRRDIIRRIQFDNTSLTNPDLIYPGQALLIDIPASNCSIYDTPVLPETEKNAIKDFQHKWNEAAPQEKEWLSALTPIMLGAGGASLTMLDTTFKTNTKLVSKIAESYNDYKTGKLTKGQYDYRRQQLLKQLEAKLGPTNYLLNGNMSPNEVLRISRKKGTVPTGGITGQINKMKNLSRLASRGGVVLSVVGLGVACHDIANASDTQEKNEILFESFGGFVGGITYGIGVSIVLSMMATPVGWFAALVIGATGAVTGSVVGYGARSWYTTYGEKIDFADKTKFSRLCT